MTRVEAEERVALSLIKGMNAQIVRTLLEQFGDLHAFYTLNMRESRRLIGANEPFLELLERRPAALEQAREELKFMERHHIRLVSLVDEEAYPVRLAQCYDAPVNLFVLGEADLSAPRMLSVVGTRSATTYGMTYTGSIIRDLKGIVGEVTIVSGLAYGIDRTAHEAAMKEKMPTIAVVAHGLGSVYPAAHRGLAASIVRGGGAIVSEYMHNMKPFRGNFLQRNRIVAGLSDAVFVAESPLRGGALNTAAHARGYDREVLALPGRITDETSQGCNKLISRQLALLATGALDIAKSVLWDIKTDGSAHPDAEQKSLFDNYKGDALIVVSFLKTQQKPAPLDLITARTGLSARDAMVALGEIDLDGLLVRHPGNRFSLL